MKRQIKIRAWDGQKLIPLHLDDWTFFEGELCHRQAPLLPVMQFTGLKDKNGSEIYEGDIIQGTRGWLSGDGYLKKGYPKRIRVFLEVKWSDGKRGDCGFYLDELCVHPDDREASEQYFYRSINYSLQEHQECELDDDNEVIWNGKNESIEIIGNIYESPHLLISEQGVQESDTTEAK